MPIIDGRFEPRTALCLAEQQVDWLALYDHVTERRATIENHARPAARKVAAAVAEHGMAPQRLVDDLAGRVEQGLRGTARFGHAEARRELRQLRGSVKATEVPDAGDHSILALLGLDAILDLVHDRARDAAVAIAAAVLAAVQRAPNDPDVLIVATTTATRTLHNRVLDLVGETLNLGRAAGALELGQPPEFAMRSEQLDKGTCGPCQNLHGEIVVVGSPEFYAYMPPAGCRGGGRCRGVYVFGDYVSQMRGPETEPGPQPDLPAIPPVEVPRRVA